MHACTVRIETRSQKKSPFQLQIAEEKAHFMAQNLEYWLINI